MRRILLILAFSTLIFHSCLQRDENNLSKEDLNYINEIISLEEGEIIELFETNGGLNGFKTSGNFITNKRLAHYWIDGENSKIHTLKYSQIDSLIAVDRRNAITYASFLKVYGAEQHHFKIFIDADSLRTWEFFNKALENWKNK